MNKEHIIRRQIEKIGSTTELFDNEWTSVPFKAVISPLWRKKSSAFEKTFTEIGCDINEYFLYIGPASHDIMTLSDRAILRGNSRAFEFKHKDKFMLNDEVLYYIGVLRLLKEADDNET